MPPTHRGRWRLNFGTARLTFQPAGTGSRTSEEMNQTLKFNILFAGAGVAPERMTPRTVTSKRKLEMQSSLFKKMAEQRRILSWEEAGDSSSGHRGDVSEVCRPYGHNDTWHQREEKGPLDSELVFTVVWD